MAIIRVQAPVGLIFGGPGDLKEALLRYRFGGLILWGGGGLIFEGAYTWRSLFLEFYDIRENPNVSKNM